MVARMHMERDGNNGNHYHYRSDYSINDSPTRTLPISSPSSSAGRSSFIEHPVSKMDTLAGVAIKYGVEVADIKRMNGLVTDLQMFALKSLQIPLPGRHPPSPCLSNGSSTPGQSSSGHTPTRRKSDMFESLQSLKLEPPQRKVSPAMSSLQGYYGLKPTDKAIASEGVEMAVYRKGGARYLEDGLLSSNTSPPLSRHRKSRSLVNGFTSENVELADDMAVIEASEGDNDKWYEKLVRRRQKSDADFINPTPEKLLRDDNSSGGGFSAISKGKGLALRPKASRTTLTADSEPGWLNPFPIGLGDSLVTDGSAAVRKSSSTSSLQDQENGNSSSIWATSKWSLKPDLPAAITRPIFDGLPKPITGRRNKAALD